MLERGPAAQAARCSRSAAAASLRGRWSTVHARTAQTAGETHKEQLALARPVGLTEWMRPPTIPALESKDYERFPLSGPFFSCRLIFSASSASSRELMTS